MAATATGSLDNILSAQNVDGAWGYRRGGSSWTEPTVYALLALRASGAGAEASREGEKWLVRTQRSDGGWAPQPAVDRSTWVTALILLLWADEFPSPPGSTAIEWLLSQTGRESTFWQRFRQQLLGIPIETDADSRGWPWFPNTAAWVCPTALSILALGKLNSRTPRREFQDRIRMGHRFLLDRMCQDGGWNHGSSRALGYEAVSYPETTGTALLALHGASSDRLATAMAAGERHLRACKSAEGQSWLRRGLMAHSRRPDDSHVPPVTCRTINDTCLTILADAAAAGRNVFLG